MARKLASDKILFAALLTLSLFGCVMIYSASAVSAAETGGNPYRYLVKQILALAAGGLAAFAVYRTDYRLLSRPWIVYTIFFAALALCGAALLAPPINAARRWLRVGALMFQPSELLKIGLVLVLAHQLAKKSRGSEGPERALLPCAVLTTLSAGIVMLEPDLGTAACLVAIAACVFWLAGARLRWFGIGAAALVPLAAVLAFSADYRKARILSFLRPEADPLGAGFQAIQSLIAVGAGGWTGSGLGASRQKLFFLPYPHTDFIFAIVGEELGFLGAFGVVGCFAVVAWRGLRAARRAPDPTAAFLAAGATAMLVVQAAINVSVVLALVPTKGIALPFVSYGGSSLVACWIAGGLLLNISQHELPASEHA
jgi:cell division protein FtsW